MSIIPTWLSDLVLKNTLLLVGGLVVILIVAYNVYSGVAIKEIGLPGIITFKLGDKAVPPINKTTAYGLTFKKIVWKHWYLINGDYKGEIEYFVKNTSEDSIITLPPYQASWFGWNKEKPNVRTVIYGEDKSTYNITQQHYSESRVVRADIDGKQKQMTTYLLQFNINPSLQPQQSLHYGLIIETKGTEIEAFSSGGSFAGVYSAYPADEMGCEIYAPEGYKFSKETYFVRDRTGAIKNIPDIKRPEFDDRKIIWNVEKPNPNVNYLVKIVLVRTN